MAAGRERSLLNDLRNQEEMAFSRGRIAHDVVRYVAVGDLVLALLHVHRRDRGHRLDALDVHPGELLDESKNCVELALEVFDLVLRTRDAGGMGDTAHRSDIDGPEGPTVGPAEQRTAVGASSA